MYSKMGMLASLGERGPCVRTPGMGSGCHGPRRNDANDPPGRDCMQLRGSTNRHPGPRNRPRISDPPRPGPMSVLRPASYRRSPGYCLAVPAQCHRKIGQHTVYFVKTGPPRDAGPTGARTVAACRPKAAAGHPDQTGLPGRFSPHCAHASECRQVGTIRRISHTFATNCFRIESEWRRQSEAAIASPPASAGPRCGSPAARRCRRTFGNNPHLLTWRRRVTLPSTGTQPAGHATHCLARTHRGPS